MLRWRHPCASEAAARAAVEVRIDAFWAAFAATTPRFEAAFLSRDALDFPTWMREHLDPIDERILWEFGPGVRGGHRLVLTPESQHALRPLVEAMVARAPALAGWEVYPYRLAEDVEMTFNTVRARVGVELTGYEVAAKAGDHGRVDLFFWGPKRLLGKDQRAEAAFVATESLLGEELLDHWIGAIAVEKGVDRVPLGELPGLVRPLIDAWIAALPDRPYHLQSADEGWFSYERKGPPIEQRRGDIIVGTSRAMPVIQALGSDAHFHSARFSRHGEVFAYLELQTPAGPVGPGEPIGSFADRLDAQDAIDALLVPASLGCVIGGATGRRHAYVDLALTDVDAAWALLQPFLAGKLPSETRLLFMDTDLSAEWLGLEAGTAGPRW